MSENQTVYVLNIEQSRDESSIRSIIGIYSSEEKAFKRLEEIFLKDTKCTESQFNSLVEEFRNTKDFYVFDDFFRKNRKVKEYYDLNFWISEVEIDKYYS
jgi:hypothetical protein